MDPLAHPLRQLGRGRLDDATWLALATELTRPFVDKRAAYPVPELVAMLHGGDFVSAYRHVHELAEHLDRRVQRGHEERRAEYGEALGALARLLEALAPLHGYAVIVPRGGRAERWRGVRRHPRAIATVTGALIDGRPLLVDFTAAWCVACKKLEALTFSDVRVQREAGRFLALRVDATDGEDPLVAATLDKLQVRGLPTLLLFDSSGKEAERITDFVEAERFVESLKRVN